MEKLANSGNEGFDAGFQALVCGAGLFGEARDRVVGVSELDSEVVHAGSKLLDLALGVSPQLAGFLAVFAALFGDACGYVRDAFETLFCGHATFSILSVARIPTWRPDVRGLWLCPIGGGLLVAIAGAGVARSPTLPSGAKE